MSRFNSPTRALFSRETEEPTAFSSTVTLAAEPWAMVSFEPGVRFLTSLILPASCTAEPFSALISIIFRP